MLKEDTVRLADGRLLGYAEYGDPDGYPVLFFHGLPGSRYWHHPDEALTAAMGIRLIVVERPGYGKSSPKPRRCVVDWADDVEQFVDHLDISAFSVGGVSGGGPHAAACAFRLPERIRAVAMVSSLAPFENIFMAKGYRRKFLFRCPLFSCLALELFTRKQSGSLSCEGGLDNLATGLSRVDRELLDDNEELAQMYDKAFSEACAQRREGILEDVRALYFTPWGFRVSELKIPVSVWHGTEDSLAPFGMGRYLADNIPFARFQRKVGEGHLLWYRNWEGILNRLSK